MGRNAPLQLPGRQDCRDRDRCSSQVGCVARRGGRTKSTSPGGAVGLSHLPTDRHRWLASAKAAEQWPPAQIRFAPPSLATESAA
eukprot:CAMPEP_0119366866 /NCGR_PEP_ID=MMETSP1334-20130426/13696_1 /TAXON_ID=127549 /ORGANISM="Calcidiscus leptoporus, Strain RCC1130" /LENGTH=84 /DNA_ID=CAMNT_0007383165 /DNA_START=68 /DNA_END=319 /DNA_ORIENTATION=-